jgi:asparagine synthase (glutamine-hydrolysing)
MCTICGVISKDDEDAVGPVLKMLKVMSHRGPDSAGMSWGRETLYAESVEELSAKAKGIKAQRALGHARLRITGESGTQPFENPDDYPKLVFNGEIYNFREIHQTHFKDEAELNGDNDGELLFRLLDRLSNGSGEEAIVRAIPHLDGVYALALMEKNAVTLYRDKVGIKQVYYGENSDYIAFASERKALWKISMRSQRLNPGELLQIKNNRLIRRKIESFKSLPIRYRESRDALEVYRDVLFKAVKKRVVGHRKLGVLFSGGVDSVLVTRVAKKYCRKVVGYIGGVPGSPDLEYAREAAKAIGIPLEVSLLDSSNIEKLIPDVIEAIEDRDLMQVEVALPMFAALKRAKEDGIRVMLTGQGADELFAGYEWYPQILNDQGESDLIRSMWNDIKNLYRDTLEREDKISMWHSIELRVPFLDPEVIRKAMMICPWLKIEKSNGTHDRLGKRLHRELAHRVGVPRTISHRTKDGAQHGSGVHEALAEVSKSVKYEPLTQAPNLDEPELRGSAFRYEGKDVENCSYGEACAQEYVDSIAGRIFKK